MDIFSWVTNFMDPNLVGIFVTSLWINWFCRNAFVYGNSALALSQKGDSYSYDWAFFTRFSGSKHRVKGLYASDFPACVEGSKCGFD